MHYHHDHDNDNNNNDDDRSKILVLVEVGIIVSRKCQIEMEKKLTNREKKEIEGKVTRNIKRQMSRDHDDPAEFPMTSTREEYIR